ncbi:hypothetical protein F4861DRAFT_494507 [Xylaria intraflava]|nr:hypothetical protein F4861DRAFT_494507 [Xylaria intraflava]
MVVVWHAFLSTLRFWRVYFYFLFYFFFTWFCLFCDLVFFGGDAFGSACLGVFGIVLGGMDGFGWIVYMGWRVLGLFFFLFYGLLVWILFDFVMGLV